MLFYCFRKITTAKNKFPCFDSLIKAFSAHQSVLFLTKVFALFCFPGYLSDRELRTLATRLYKLPLDQQDLSSFQRTLKNCSNASNETTHTLAVEKGEDFLPMVSEDFIQRCETILKMLNNSNKGATKYKYETLADEDVAFHMIRDNASKVLQQLDAIRSVKKKFVCLNDNIDHSKKDADLIKALLIDFYESLFPIPSQFELMHEYRNRFLYVSELNEWLRNRELTRFWMSVLLVFSLTVAFFSLFPGILSWIVQRLCPFRRLFFPVRSLSSESSRLLTV